MSRRKDRPQTNFPPSPTPPTRERSEQDCSGTNKSQMLIFDEEEKGRNAEGFDTLIRLVVTGNSNDDAGPTRPTPAVEVAVAPPSLLVAVSLHISVEENLFMNRINIPEVSRAYTANSQWAFFENSCCTALLLWEGEVGSSAIYQQVAVTQETEGQLGATFVLAYTSIVGSPGMTGGAGRAVGEENQPHNRDLNRTSTEVVLVQQQPTIVNPPRKLRPQFLLIYNCHLFNSISAPIGGKEILR